MPDDRLSYDVVDVFTATPFAGNPLAVVYGADALTTDQLHRIAVEFNLSETTFPVSLTDEDSAAGADYRVRIFTGAGEIPFAGHPTLGSAWSLWQRGELAPGSRMQSCGAGLVQVELPSDASAPVSLAATPRDRAQELSDGDAAAVAELVGLTFADVAGPVAAAGSGLTFVHLPVVASAVGRARPGGRRLDELGLSGLDLTDPLAGINVVGLAEGEDGIRVNARVFVPGFSIPEDPATGSAAAGLGIALVAAGVAGPDGETRYRIDQGVDMGRPSVLSCRVEARGGEAVRCHVAGQVVPIATGAIAIPPPLEP